MRRSWRICLFASGLALAGGASAAASAAVDTVTLLGGGADENALFQVDMRAPSGQLTPIQVFGLAPGDVLRGIDYRPANGMLYGVATNLDTVTTYSIVPTLGAATPVGTATVTGVGAATEFGVSIDPVADRIRVVTNLASDGAGGTVNNFRLNPVDGARADTPIADADLDFTALPGGNGSAPAAALAHHLTPGATVATTYALVTGNDRLVRLGGLNGSPSASLGVLQAIGELDVSAAATAGFDIDPTSGIGYAVLSVGGRPRAYTVDLATGGTRPTSLDNRVGTIARVFTGLAIPPRPTLAFAPAPPSAAEGEPATVTVTRTGGTHLPSSVRYLVRPGAGSSAAGTDYAPTSGVLSFATGATSATFAVPTAEDAAFEGNETVEVELFDPAGADLAAAPSITTLTIVDDDPAPPAGPPAYAPPTAPLGLLSIGDQPIDRSLTATVSCDQACRATMVLRLDRRTLVSRRVRLTAPGRRRVALSLSRAEVALLTSRARGPRTVLLRLSGTFADADGRTRAAVAVRLD
jgi:hypothetical protein